MLDSLDVVFAALEDDDPVRDSAGSDSVAATALDTGAVDEAVG